ncbi:MAG: PKD domain-containing protein [Thermoguttaceae bacterium]|jgi:PKD repeat protein|nr:PKD domain-containing protein [Thermoguttaceae bacterium]
MRCRVVLVALLMFSAGSSLAALGQTFRRAGVEFQAVRPINLPPGKTYSVVVTQFFHHAQINAEGTNVLVATKAGKPVPTRVLQLGPGDYCRLAFEPQSGQNAYEIFYGGDAPAASEVPPWTSKDGLLLETREFKPCNLHRLDSVREAFHSSKPIGADYVDRVQHAHNPFALTPAPFLSRYSGTMHLATAATYGFITSSQDCSFLLIDDKVVVEAPGAHGPAHHALRGSRKDVALSAGPHKFEYYHAASGPQAFMVAAWEINPRDPKPEPVAIPPEVFHAGSIGREAAGSPSMRGEKVMPDFVMNLAGSVPLPDREIPLVRVQFRDASPRSLALNSKFLWEFGDGQTSEQPNPEHVYLRPGLYPVKLTVRRAGRPFEIVHRVYVDQPKITARDQLDELDAYLPILEKYDPRTLDAAALGQLVAAYQAKADALLATPDETEDLAAKPGRRRAKAASKAIERTAEAPPTPEELAKERQLAAARKAEAMKYTAAAVEAGKVALVAESAAKGDDDLLKLARLVGPMLRDQLGDSRQAGAIWQGAARRIAAPEAKGECLVEAADIAVNDLANPKVARTFLDQATENLKAPKAKELAARLQRVWGDYYALAGDGKAARKAYAAAETLTASTRTNAERIAWQGAHGRSTEQFLKTEEYDRAAAQIRQWQEEFPADKIHGYITYLYARYWAGRKQYAAAIALAGQLAAVNADSPYIDQLLLLAAECERAMGDAPKAVARLESLLKNYPGSPLVPLVKERLAQWKSSEGAKGARDK